MRSPSLRIALFAAILSFAVAPLAHAQANWQASLDRSLPTFGHRNWILIVDSAYPAQVGPGIEIVDTGADQIDVLRTVLGTLQNSIHVRPIVFLDAELPYVPDQEAPGISEYRRQLTSLLAGFESHARLHQSLIDQVAKDSQLYHVLILKTRLTIPYTSVFLHLDCKYWSAANERGLRQSMSGAHIPGEPPRQ